MKADQNGPATVLQNLSMWAVHFLSAQEVSGPLWSYSPRSPSAHPHLPPTFLLFLTGVYIKVYMDQEISYHS